MKPDNRPIHLKFGYDHMVEMTAIRTSLVGTGLTAIELHFAAIREYEKRHCNDPSYRERQKEWLATQRPLLDPCIEALKLIRDGANDARTLARVTLEALGIS